MKKLLIVITALLVSTGAIAQHGHGGHGYYGGGHGGGNWIGPLIGGVVLGTIITNSQRQVILQQPPVIVQQPPIFNFPIQNYYSCLVQVQDPYSGVIRNEVRTCVNQ
jgi:hypothetical protein